MYILGLIITIVLVIIIIDPRLDITDNQCILWYSNFEGKRCYLILWNKMIIINKDKLNSDLVHDINLELEALFTDNRTWEISSSTGDLDDASDVRIVIKGVEHCYISTIGDTEEYVRDLLNSYRKSHNFNTFCMSTMYFDPEKNGIVFEYADYISL